MLYGEWVAGTGDMAAVTEVRNKVFIEEQGWPESVENDGNDKFAWHALVLEDETPIATGRVYMDGGEYKIGRVAVLKEYRQRGIGNLIVRSLLGRALNSGAKGVSVSAQLHAKGLYEKYGFKPVGEPYKHPENDVTQIDMYVAAEDITVPGSCGGNCGSCGNCG